VQRLQPAFRIKVTDALDIGGRAERLGITHDGRTDQTESDGVADVDGFAGGRVAESSDDWVDETGRDGFRECETSVSASVFHARHGERLRHVFTVIARRSVTNVHVFDCGTLYTLYSGCIRTLYVLGWGVGA